MKTLPISTVDQMISRIRSFIKENNLTNVEVAERAGLSEAAIRCIFKDNTNPTADTMRAIESIIPSGFQPKTDAP